MGWVGGDTYNGVGFGIVFLPVVLSRFDCLGGGVLARLPYEVGMVKSSEGFVIVRSYGGIGSVGIIPGVFSLVTCWCVHGDKRI